MKTKSEIINSVYPVTHLEVYESGIEVIRGNNIPDRPLNPVDAKRGAIQELSRSSSNRLAFLVRTTKAQFLSMMTLSYGRQFPIVGKESKGHLKSMLRELTDYYDGLGYVWWLEFQDRGAIHYHILLTHNPTRYCREWTAYQWASISTPNVKYSDIKTKTEVHMRRQVERVHMHKSAWQRLRSTEGAARYTAKYATKQKQKIVPKGVRAVGRFWGANRVVTDYRRDSHKVDITNNDEAVDLVRRYRPDVADWDVLPKFIFR